MNLTLDNGGDLIAAVPLLLGFHPVDSVVVVTIADDAHGERVGPVLRLDLPSPRDAPGGAAYLAQAVGKHGVREVFVLICGGGTDLTPHRSFVDEMRAALGAVGVAVTHALWAPAAQAGQTWWCYDDPGCTGVIPDPDTLPLAAAMTFAGLVRYPDRAALVDSLAQDPPDVLERRAILVDSLICAELHAADDGSCDQDAFAKDVAAVWAAVDEFADLESSTVEGAKVCRTEPEFDDQRIARLTVALSHSDVRGECLKIILSDRAPAAIRLWTRLTKALPAPERAEPACLLAIGAYLRGDGTLAHIALDVAADADPGHELARLLRAALENAIAPTELRELLRRASSGRASS
jgi:hypothetical protein